MFETMKENHSMLVLNINIQTVVQIQELTKLFKIDRIKLLMLLCLLIDRDHEHERA